MGSRSSMENQALAGGKMAQQRSVPCREMRVWLRENQAGRRAKRSGIARVMAAELPALLIFRGCFSRIGASL